MYARVKRKDWISPARTSFVRYRFEDHNVSELLVLGLPIEGEFEK